MFTQVPKWHKFIFIALLLIIYAVIGVFSALPKRPQSVHQWAQCDRASVAKCYYEESMDFLLPRTHHRNESEGVVGMEFPFINYTAAVLYKIFGFHEFLYRLVMMLIVTGGIFSAYLICVSFLKNVWFAMGIVLVWALSPVLNYYTPNFVPDAGSMGFAMVAWYFVFRYVDTQKRSNILGFILFAALASLIKISSAITVVAVACLVILDYLKFYEKFKKRDRILWLLATVLVLGVTFWWYNYATYVQLTRQSAIFTLEPHYIKSWPELKETWSAVYGIWFYSYYSFALWMILAFSIAYFIWQNRLLNRFLLSVTVLLYLGMLAFLAVMFAQFSAHDYYVITLLPAFFFHLLLLADVLNKHLKPKQIAYFVLPLLLIMIVYSTIYSREDYDKRYGGWMSSLSAGTEKYFDIEPYLRSLGISPLDQTLIIYDDSFNILLYLMNQRGFTMWRVHDPDYIEYPLRCKVKYIVLNDKTYLPEHPQYKKYFNNKIGEYQGIEIYKVSY